jgi:hypothetical protein
MLAVTHASPYVSLKLMAYSAPLLTLTAVSAFVPRRTPHRPARPIVIPIVVLSLFSATLLFGFTTFVTVVGGLITVKPATSLSEVVAAAERLPQARAIRIDYADGWKQMWLVYYLRDRRLAVPRPSVTLTGFSAADAATHRSFTAPAAYAIAPDERGPAIWRGSGAAIYALSPQGNARSAVRRSVNHPNSARPRSTNVKTIRDVPASANATPAPMRREEP